LALSKTPEMELAYGHGTHRAMRLSIDHHPAATADALATIVLEGDGVLALSYKALVDHIEHFEKGHVLVESVRVIALETARGPATGLSPDVEDETHYR
jgi:hypothetical protein